MNFLFMLLFGIFSFSAYAANPPTLSNLNQADASAIMKNFGNAVVFRAVEPPSANGKIWGIGVGIAGDVTSATDTNNVLSKSGTSPNISALPGADLVLTLQAPLGLSAEAGFLPRMTFSGLSEKRTAFNVKWTFTDLFLRGQTPFDAAVRVGFGRNEFSYGQTTNGVQDTVKFDSKAFRAELAFSRKILVFEPFIGLGLLRTSNPLSNTANASLYSFTNSQSYEYSKSSFVFNIGAEVRLLILTVGAQVEWAFGETAAAAKVGLKF